MTEPLLRMTLIGKRFLGVQALDNAGLEVLPGEIHALLGENGAGKSTLINILSGAQQPDSGAIRYRIGLVPEDRKKQALFLALAVRIDPSMAAHQRIKCWGVFIDEAAERAMAEEYRKKLNIRMASPEQLIASLSGGNQQKVTLARWLALRSKVLIVDEPTRGIDIGAKVEVHNRLFEMARSSIAAIAISSELPEVLAISDRIVTTREGHVTGEINSEDASKEILMSMMTLSASLVHRLIYTGDVVAFKMGRRQGGPSRTGGRRAHIRT
jgi:inositol transport system ATP-binding protein